MRSRAGEEGGCERPGTADRGQAERLGKWEAGIRGPALWPVAFVTVKG